MSDIEYEVIKADHGYFAIDETWWLEGSTEEVPPNTEGAYPKLSLSPIIGFLVEVAIRGSKYHDGLDVDVYCLGVGGISDAEYVLTPDLLIIDVNEIGDIVKESYPHSIMDFDNIDQIKEFFAQHANS